jgi:hypothetical protein
MHSPSNQTGRYKYHFLPLRYLSMSVCGAIIVFIILMLLAEANSTAFAVLPRGVLSRVLRSIFILVL